MMAEESVWDRLTTFVTCVSRMVRTVDVRWLYHEIYYSTLFAYWFFAHEFSGVDEDQEQLEHGQRLRLETHALSPRKSS